MNRPQVAGFDLPGDIQSSANFITDTYLISAYDLSRRHLPPPSNFPCKPELLFLDSGGYEVSNDQDLSAVLASRPNRRKWDLNSLVKVLDNWPEEIATVLVSYDHPKERRSFGEQIDAARKLFKGRPHLCTFILKPEKQKDTMLNGALDQAMVHAAELQSFDIIGLTEKELGCSILERMVRLAKFRRALNDARISAPIHVFGALDPLSTCLYFLAGAEIFDGLTWMRYAYDERGQCVYASNHGAISFGLDVSENIIKVRVMAENLNRMRQLQRKLREFEVTGHFEKLAPHDKLLKDAADTLETALQKGEY